MKTVIEELYSDIKKLEEKYNLSYKEILGIVEKKKISLPLSIFSSDLGSLESSVKYLRENLSLSLKEISVLLGRDVKPIRTTYNRAAKKFPKKLDSSSKETIPVEILVQEKFSVLESLVGFLLDRGHSLQSISSILHRDYKTIWTIKKRLQKK